LVHKEGKIVNKKERCALLAHPFFLTAFQNRLQPHYKIKTSVSAATADDTWPILWTTSINDRPHTLLQLEITIIPKNIPKNNDKLTFYLPHGKPILNTKKYFVFHDPK